MDTQYFETGILILHGFYVWYPLPVLLGIPLLELECTCVL